MVQKRSHFGYYFPMLSAESIAVVKLAVKQPAGEYRLTPIRSAIDDVWSRDMRVGAGTMWRYISALRRYRLCFIE